MSILDPKCEGCAWLEERIGHEGLPDETRWLVCGNPDAPIAAIFHKEFPCLAKASIKDEDESAS